MASELVWFPHPTRCYALGAVTNRAGDKISLRDTGAAPAHGSAAAAGAVPVPGSPNLTVGGGAGAGESHTVATDKTLACDPTHLTDVDGETKREIERGRNRRRGGRETIGGSAVRGCTRASALLSIFGLPPPPCADLATMNNLHEAPLLCLLECRLVCAWRYRARARGCRRRRACRHRARSAPSPRRAAAKIYTLCGDILISLNPYRS